MVDALGGITMDFPTEVKDQYTGLDVTTTGCQSVNGTVALQLVRSRPPLLHELQRLLGVRRPVGLQPHPAPGRLLPGRAGQGEPVHHQPLRHQLVHRCRRRQPHHRRHARARATSSTSPRTSAGSRRPTWSPRRCPRLGYVDRRRRRRAEGGPALRPEHDRRLQPDRDDPGAGDHHAAGASGTRATTTTTVPTEAHGQVGVERPERVDGQRHRPHHGDGALAQGFDVTEIGDASSPSPRAGPPRSATARPATRPPSRSASVLGGPVTLVPDPSLSGQTVSLLVAGSQLTVTGVVAERHAPTTTTTTATGPTTTTTTTIPADVYTNTQPEPWNPSPAPSASRPRRTPDDDDGAEEVASGPVGPASRAQADLRRCRTIRRRSRSVVPPQMPSRSRWARACSRHA